VLRSVRSSVCLSTSLAQNGACEGCGYYTGQRGCTATGSDGNGRDISFRRRLGDTFYLSNVTYGGIMYAYTVLTYTFINNSVL